MRRLEQALLGPIYGLATRARGLVWGVGRPILVGVRALVLRDGAVLLVRHRRGRTPWSLPGGGVERYERLEEAARREVDEESGVLVRDMRLLGVYDSFRGGVSNYITVFVGAGLNEPRPPRSLEIAEARFFPLDALPKGVDRGTRDRIAEYRAGTPAQSKLW